MALELVNDWDGPVSDGNRYWHDLSEFEDSCSWIYDKPEDIPEMLICMSQELPTWNAENLMESLTEWLDDNHHNDEGQYWSEFLDREKKEELKPKFQALIDEFIQASSWRTYKRTDKRIKVLDSLRKGEEK